MALPIFPEAEAADQLEKQWQAALSLEATGCPGSLDIAGDD